MVVVIDTREQKKAYVYDKLRKLGVSATLLKLDYGDYLLPRGAVIERKSVSDLVSSIPELPDKLAMMKEKYEYPILLVEGRVDVRDGVVAIPYGEYFMDTNMTYKSFVNFLVSIQCKGILLFWTNNLDQTATVIAYLHDYFSKDTHMPLVRRDISDGFSRAVSALSMIDGIDTVLAKRLLKNLGTVSSVANADIRRLMDVDGIGRGKAEKIYRFFHEQEFVYGKL